MYWIYDVLDLEFKLNFISSRYCSAHRSAMETGPPEPNLKSIQLLVGDEPSRTVDVEHASESGEAAGTHGPNHPRLPGNVVVNRDHAKTIYEAAQYYALLYGIQVPVSSTGHTFILVVEMTSVLHISKSKRSCS